MALCCPSKSTCSVYAQQSLSRREHKDLWGVRTGVGQIDGYRDRIGWCHAGSRLSPGDPYGPQVGWVSCRGATARRGKTYANQRKSWSAAPRGQIAVSANKVVVIDSWLRKQGIYVHESDPVLEVATICELAVADTVERSRVSTRPRPTASPQRPVTISKQQAKRCHSDHRGRQMVRRAAPRGDAYSGSSPIGSHATLYALLPRGLQGFASGPEGAVPGDPRGDLIGQHTTIGNVGPSRVP